MSFIETMPEDDIIKLAERLQQYILPKSVEESNKKNADTNYSVKEVAKITKRSKQTIRAHIKIGLLNAKKPGKNYIVTQENLTKYIENEK